MIEARFDGENIACFEDIVPGRVQVGGFVRIESDAVTQVVREPVGTEGIKSFLCVAEQIAACDARAGRFFDIVQHRHDGFPGEELLICDLTFDSHGAAIVCAIAAVTGAQVQDKQFAGSGRAIPRWSARGSALEIIPQCGQRFAGGLHGHGMQMAENIQFRDTWPDQVACSGVHGFGARNGLVNHGEFIGILAPSESPEFGVEVNEGIRSGVTAFLEVQSAGREFRSDAECCRGRQDIEQCAQRSFRLILSQSGQSLSRKRYDSVGCDRFRNLNGTGKETITVG